MLRLLLPFFSGADAQVSSWLSPDYSIDTVLLSGPEQLGGAMLATCLVSRRYMCGVRGALPLRSQRLHCSE